MTGYEPDIGHNGYGESEVRIKKYTNCLEREFTDGNVLGLAFASRLLLSRLGPLYSIPALMLPFGVMAARHQNGATLFHKPSHRNSATSGIAVLCRYCVRGCHIATSEFQDELFVMKKYMKNVSTMLEQTGSILALVLPSGSMVARHRKGATAERFFFAMVAFSSRRKSLLISLSAPKFPDFYFGNKFKSPKLL
ncbi:hypothetical protein CSKR_114463 [Clonorchis sinensis]|uniref:Uncharacterized protein n=1 Tax=Clonorchis sinensis TaxID=79923 RepID=A0A419PJU9_CLOSI|nr:hypothetical protein CSKR_114463 [Clonorchis sinensis]